jgi:murein L,D-transpeptidase YcbB/YkuD
MVTARTRAASLLAECRGPVVGALALCLITFSGARAEKDNPGFLESLFGDGTPGISEQDAAKKRREEAAKAEEALLDQLTPRDLFISYEAERALIQAIENYQRLAGRGGWPKVPTGKTLRPGDMDEVVATIRARLEVSGDLKPTGDTSWTYDEALVEGVLRFQRRHGIPPSGKVDSRTISAMNVPVEDRLAQLRVNLLRVREMLGLGLPLRYVLVNVPSYDLQAVDGGRIVVQSRVVAGRPEAPTPTVAAKIKGLNFFPYWNVPDTVASRDLIPKLRKDPGYLEREGIRAQTDWGGQDLDPRYIDWAQPQPQLVRFRQDPGPKNALGLVRIDMPNEHIVYMHDTPLKNLFGRSVRAYSAGCVRVQKVFELVTWLASLNGDWDRARVDSVLASGLKTDVVLNEPVDVFFLYLTAWASADGEVSFRPDVYGRDGAAQMADSDDREAPPESLLLSP